MGNRDGVMGGCRRIVGAARRNAPKVDGRLDRPEAAAILSPLPQSRRIHETNISAKPEQAQGESRFPQTDEHGRRAEGVEATSRQRATSAHGVGWRDDGRAGRENTGGGPAAARCAGERWAVDGVRREGVQRCGTTDRDARADRRRRDDAQPHPPHREGGFCGEVWSAGKHGRAAPCEERCERPAAPPGPCQAGRALGSPVKAAGEPPGGSRGPWIESPASWPPSSGDTNGGWGQPCRWPAASPLPARSTP